MKKIIMLICLILTGCSSYDIKEVDNSLIIDEIKLNNIYNISSIYDDVIGIVMFSEYGRPDIDGSNTVIGAHSGYGNNALFNDIKYLKKDDIITLYYDNNEYKYIVREVKEVLDTEIDVLRSNNESVLTLITCKIEDRSKRIVVIADIIINS